MIGLVIGIIASVHFYIEARKRAESGIKWACIAFFTFFGIQIFSELFVTPTIMALLNLDRAHPLAVGLAFATLIIAFYFLVVARKRLYSRKRILEEHSDTDIVVESFDINDNSDGTFSVSGRSFPSKKDAEEFVSLVQRRPE